MVTKLDFDKTSLVIVASPTSFKGEPIVPKFAVVTVGGVVLNQLKSKLVVICGEVRYLTESSAFALLSSFTSFS
jgi:hypothetical protein